MQQNKTMQWQRVSWIRNRIQRPCCFWTVKVIWPAIWIFEGNKLFLPGEINMNRKLIKDLNTDESDDLSAVNMAKLKKFSTATPSSSGTAADIDLQDKLNVKNSNSKASLTLHRITIILCPMTTSRTSFFPGKKRLPWKQVLTWEIKRFSMWKIPPLQIRGRTRNMWMQKQRRIQRKWTNWRLLPTRNSQLPRINETKRRTKLTSTRLSWSSLEERWQETLTQEERK